MSSRAINQTALQNIHVTKQQAAANAPLRRQAEARLYAQQAKAREARLIAAKKAEAAAREAARLAAAKAEEAKGKAATAEVVTPEAKGKEEQTVF